MRNTPWTPSQRRLFLAALVAATGSWLAGIVGADPGSQAADGDKVQLYRWESGQGTYLYTSLLVRIHERDGVTGKTVTGPNGNKTETYGGE